MASVFGKNIRYSLFGESHGQAIGIVIDGIKSGVKLDFDYIRRQMDRRRPGKNAWSTKRNEKDEFEIQSGVFEGHTTGTPICAMIKNTDKRSRDYSKTKDVFRPSHADHTGSVRYSGYNDYRGGGHFSGRLTAPIVFAGSIARQMLCQRGIEIAGHIKQIGSVKDKSFLEAGTIETEDVDFPLLDSSVKEKMKSEIEKARLDEDSIGGIAEIAIVNMPSGVGDPFFESIESRLSSGLFSIPAVKGVSFGAGFEFASMHGSEANDQMEIVDGKVVTRTNNNGGILGGISNGMPIVISVAIKPTPSIGKEQDTVDRDGNQVKLKIEGRHDPCIVPRAIPVLESMCAMTILDILGG